jgi:phage shock protein A
LERKEQNRLAKELEALEKNYMELSHKSKYDIQMRENQIESLKKQLDQAEDAKNKFIKSSDHHETDIRELKRKINQK